MMKEKIYKILKAISFYLIIITAWEGLHLLLVDVLKIARESIFASPFTVAETLFDFVFKNSDSFWLHLSDTLVRLFGGFLLSAIVGTVIAVLMLWCSYYRDNIRALLSGIQSLPNICWVPFAIIISGLDENAVYFVMVCGAAPAIATAIDSSFRNVDPVYIRAGKTLGCNKIGMYTRVYIPASMPSLIFGLKQGWAFSWRALMAGEMNCLFSVRAKGLGYLMYNLRFNGEIDKVLCIMIVLVLIGVFFEKVIFGSIENRILRKRGINRENER